MQPKSEFDHKMIAVAKRRGIVRLQSGQLATLISWGTRESRQRCRLEGSDGETRWNSKLTEIIEIVQ